MIHNYAMVTYVDNGRLVINYSVSKCIYYFLTLTNSSYSQFNFMKANK